MLSRVEGLSPEVLRAFQYALESPVYARLLANYIASEERLSLVLSDRFGAFSSFQPPGPTYRAQQLIASTLAKANCKGLIGSAMASSIWMRRLSCGCKTQWLQYCSPLTEPTSAVRPAMSDLLTGGLRLVQCTNHWAPYFEDGRCPNSLVQCPPFFANSKRDRDLRQERGPSDRITFLLDAKAVADTETDDCNNWVVRVMGELLHVTNDILNRRRWISEAQTPSASHVQRRKRRGARNA